MRKSITIVVLVFLLIAPLLLAPAVQAAYNDFIANSNITVTGVAGSGVTSADFTIINGSTAESWSVSSAGVFTVTVAEGSEFSITCGNTSVLAINYIMSGYTNCADNSTPGSSMVVLRGTGTFTIAPKSTNCSGGSSVAPPPSGGGTSTPTPTPIAETPLAIPKTTVPTTAPTTPSEPAKDSAGNITLEQMASDAKTVATADVNQVIGIIGAQRDAVAENNFAKTITAKITDSSAPAETKTAINNFVTYGTPSTKILGAGERGGVVASYQAAFGKLPANINDWGDVVKIANGRWPGQISKQAENRAAVNFKAVYKRNPNKLNSSDNNALKVMAYGLRPAKRNTANEKAAINSFKSVYGYNPAKATAWDVVRAIAYSGAKR